MKQAVALAGRLGTRSPPLTEQIPKPLVPVHGKPFLHHQFDLLKSFGATEILLLVGYLGWKIEEYFGDGSNFGLRIEYSREQTPLGSAGAVGGKLLGAGGGGFFLLYCEPEQQARVREALGGLRELSFRLTPTVSEAIFNDYHIPATTRKGRSE